MSTWNRVPREIPVGIQERILREVADRERDSFPARRIPIRSPRHREFAELSVATPRSLYQSTICASQTRPIEIKEDPWYAAQHHIPILPPPARIGRKEHFGTVDEPAFPKDPMEVNKQQIRVLRDQVKRERAYRKEAEALAAEKKATHAYALDLQKEVGRERQERKALEAELAKRLRQQAATSPRNYGLLGILTPLAPDCRG